MSKGRGAWRKKGDFIARRSYDDEAISFRQRSTELTPKSDCRVVRVAVGTATLSLLAKTRRVDYRE